MTYISWSSDFALYLEDCLMYDHHTSGLWVRIMSQYDLTFDLKINVGCFDLYFMVQWFCLIILKPIDIWTPYFGIMSQYDPMFDLKIIVGRCNLYFMIQGFCLISWRLFAVWTSYFRIMSQYDPTFDLKINVGHSNLFFHSPVILPYILNSIWWMNVILLENESLTSK